MVVGSVNVMQDYQQICNPSVVREGAKTIKGQNVMDQFWLPDTYYMKLGEFSKSRSHLLKQSTVS